MRKYLVTAAFLLCLVISCNNKKTSVGEPVIANDSAVSMMTDLTASTDIKKLLCQDWENKEDAEDAALSGEGEGLEMPYRGFSFFVDETVVENPRDDMRFGKWSINEADKVISIKYSNGEKAQYKIVAIGPKQMILMNTAGKKKIEYRADAQVHENPSDDPFHLSNNQWRVKPLRAETDSAIKIRTEQCVLFYAKFLDDNAKRGGNIISFVGLPSCFKWYRGGVSVTGENKVEAKWINCFYNKEQAMKGHTMLESIISKKYRWNKEEKNWVKQSADVVMQMYDTLKLL